VYFSSLAEFSVSIFSMMQVTWDEFEKIDMRVGTIVEVSDFPKARNPSYQIKIDFGALGLKKSAAQITTLYRKEELIGKQVIAVVNFPPRQIANFFSECLVLGVYSDHSVVLLQPDRKVANGEKIG
jgi:tRNA-binding protein